jgi:predicted membrane-bound spermidine synthase
MDESILILVVLAIAIGGLVGVASLLQRRQIRSKDTRSELPMPGPVAQTLLWAIRLLIVGMVLSVIGFFVFKTLSAVWIALGLLIGYMVIGRLYQIARIAGK